MTNERAATPSEAVLEVIRASKKLQRAMKEFTAACAKLRDEDRRFMEFSIGLEGDIDG